MKQFVAASILLFGIASCTSNQKSQVQQDEEPNIYRVEDTDRDMNLAIDSAQSTLYQFTKAFKSKQFDSSTFALKVRFPTASGGEHIWLSDIEYEKGHFYGIINNVPVEASSIQLGDRIKVKIGEVSDWLYSDNGVLQGGYTIKLVRRRMPREERKQFDAEFPFMIME